MHQRANAGSVSPFGGAATLVSMTRRGRSDGALILVLPVSFPLLLHEFEDRNPRDRIPPLYETSRGV
jgi:hypothetical protein